jgi:hypothetical protein
MRDSTALATNGSLNAIDRSSWVEFEPNETIDVRSTSTEPNPLHVLSSVDRLTPVDSKCGHPLASDSKSYPDTPNRSASSAPNPLNRQRATSGSSAMSHPHSNGAATITPSASNTFDQTTTIGATIGSPIHSPIILRKTSLTANGSNPSQSITNLISTKDTSQANASRPSSTLSVGHPPYRQFGIHLPSIHSPLTSSLFTL